MPKDEEIWNRQNKAFQIYSNLVWYVMVLKAMKFVHFLVFEVKFKLNRLSYSIYITLIQCNGLESNKKFLEKNCQKKNFVKKNSLKKKTNLEKKNFQEFSEVPKFRYFLKII